jgi:hypothetical protein
LTLPLFHITSHHTTLLHPLRRRRIRRALRRWRSILRHFHALSLIRIDFRRALRRKVLWGRLAVVERWWLGVGCAALLLLRVGLAVGVVALGLGVEGEVVLRDLAVAFAFGVGY